MSTLFADLGLPARLVEALAADGMTEAFPVQAITLPDALAGKDLCGRAPTGSGKTLGFGIPMMVRISQAEPTKPTGLVLVPTRELAEQVQRAFVPLGRAQWRFIQAIYGGASFGPQIHSLRKGASVVVATPGRLLDIIEKGYCDLSAVEVCVIDEADRMADLGFMPDVRKILDMTPSTRQTMLWSATLDGDVNEIIRDYMKDPVRHDLMDDVEEAPVDHKFIVTRPTERLDSAVALIEEHGPTIVFVKTRFGVDDVSEDLNRAGVKAGALHGARSQAVRQRVLEDFKRGKLQALVATDVAARGIHVDNVSLVIHYDMPDNDKDYTHRSGRTGRAGQAGVVVAFVPPSRQRLAEKMGDAVGNEITWTRGEKPVERVPASERETGNRDRGERERNDRGDRSGYRGSNRSDAGDRSGRGDRSSYGERGNYSGGNYGRGNSGDRPDRPAASDRPSYGDRPVRPTSDRPGGGDRPSYGDRPARPTSDRPSYGDRPPYGDRPGRPTSDRPSYGDRPSTGGYRGNNDRPSGGDRNARPGSDRPNYGDRTARPASTGGGYRGNNDRPGSADRPSYGADRTARPGADRASTGGYRGNNDRPTGDRPSYGADRGHNNWTPRPPRADGPPRDRNEWSPRPRRDDDRGTAGGRFGRDDRPASNRDAPRPGSQSDRPGFGGAARNDRPGAGRPQSAAARSDRPWQKREGSTGDRPAFGGGACRTDRPGQHAGGHTPNPTRKSSGFKPGGARPSAAKGGFRAAPGGRARPEQT